MNNNRSFDAQTRFASETLSSTIFEDRFSPYVLTIVSQFIVILTKKQKQNKKQTKYKQNTHTHTHTHTKKQTNKNQKKKKKKKQQQKTQNVVV